MEYDAEKLRKLNDLKEKGINPFPYRFEKNISVEELLEKYSKLKDEEHTKDAYSMAGRIMQLRRMGKVTFIHLEDVSGKIQLYFREDDLGKPSYKLLKKYDIGDIIGVKGEIFKTKTGEISIYVREHLILCKSLSILPEKYHGLQDKELRYRKRYLDLIMNRDVKEVFMKRSQIIKVIRDFMHERGYMEVETPLLQTQYGGANARPFITHINAWNMPMYLAISPELYLKRLIVGGYERVFTICKNFRNEGVDFKHNPEFTMLEAYAAYEDYNDMMKLIEDCYEYVALKVNGTTKVKHILDGKEVEIDFKAPWPRMTYFEAIKKYAKINVDKMDVKELMKFAKENKLEFAKDASWGDLVSLIFDELVESKIIQPTHIPDRPKENSPLCKIHRKDERLIEQNEPIGLGMELCNMYSELNDPQEQEKTFNEQVEKGRGGFEESHPMDSDFLECLSYGMPPTGGIGFGVDRMIILLTGVSSIRDIILFPTMKPRDDDSDKDKKSSKKK